MVFDSKKDLMIKTVVELKKMAKDGKLRGYSKLRKSELVDFIIKYSCYEIKKLAKTQNKLISQISKEEKKKKSLNKEKRRLKNIIKYPVVDLEEESIEEIRIPKKDKRLKKPKSYKQDKIESLEPLVPSFESLAQAMKKYPLQKVRKPRINQDLKMIEKIESTSGDIPISKKKKINKVPLLYKDKKGDVKQIISYVKPKDNLIDILNVSRDFEISEEEKQRNRESKAETQKKQALKKQAILRKQKLNF